MNNNKIKPPFQPPEQYFDQLPGQLMESIRASESAEDKKLVLPLDRALPFSVPEGYFEQLGQQVMSVILSVKQSELYLHTLNADRMFLVPEGYFETFAGQVMYGIQQVDDDLIDTSFLEGMKDKQPYQVPAGYFEEVRFQFATGTAAEKQPDLKVIRPNRRMWKWTNWAAAASVFIIFAVGGAWMFGTEGIRGQKKPHQLALQMLSSVSDEDIKKYIENDQESFDIYRLMDNASASNKPSNRAIKNTTEKLLDDISAEDIDAYLEYEGI